MTDAYTNKLPMIDLSRESVEIIPLPEGLKQEYLGGKGFGALDMVCAQAGSDIKRWNFTCDRTNI